MKGYVHFVAAIVLVILFAYVMGFLPTGSLGGNPGAVVDIQPYSRIMDFTVNHRCGSGFDFVVENVPDMDYQVTGTIQGCDPGGCNAPRELGVTGKWERMSVNSYKISQRDVTDAYVFSTYRLPWSEQRTCSYPIHLEFTLPDVTTTIGYTTSTVLPTTTIDTGITPPDENGEDWGIFEWLRQLIRDLFRN